MNLEKKCIYGIHSVKSILSMDLTNASLYCIESHQSHIIKKIIKIAKAKSVVIYSTSKSFFNDILNKYFPNEKIVHQNIFLLCNTERKLYQESYLNTLQCNNQTFILILDSLQDPRNFGACIRTADAVDISCIVYSKNRSPDVESGIMSKASSGAIERVPLVSVSNLHRTIKNLKSKGVWILGLSIESNTSFFSLNLKSPVAIVMGSEGSGLRPIISKECDYLASLPMTGNVSSLNVSVAAAVAMYEVVRQRLV